MLLYAIQFFVKLLFQIAQFVKLTLSPAKAHPEHLFFRLSCLVVLSDLFKHFGKFADFLPVFLLVAFELVDIQQQFADLHLQFLVFFLFAAQRLRVVVVFAQKIQILLFCLQVFFEVEFAAFSQRAV